MISKGEASKNPRIEQVIQAKSQFSHENFPKILAAAYNNEAEIIITPKEAWKLTHDRSNELSGTAIHFLELLAKFDNKSSKKELFDSIVTFISQALVDPRTPGETTVRVRKTALSFYKLLRVTPPKYEQGGNKSVAVGIGVDSNLSSPLLDAILRKIGSIRMWSGDFREIGRVTPQQREHQRLVQILPNREVRETLPKKVAKQTSRIMRKMLGLQRKKERQFIIPPAVVQEFKFIDSLKDTLPNSTYLPDVKILGPNNIYNEYLPHEFAARNEQELMRNMYELIMIVEELWKKGQIINLDLKPDNVRTRANGEPVIFDWGSKVEVPKGHSFVEIPGGVPVTKVMLPPEYAAARYENKPVDVDKLLVYSIARMLLIDVYGVTAIKTALKNKHGFVWPSDPNFCTVNEETMAHLDQDGPIFPISDGLGYLLFDMIKENPDARPTLNQVKERLRKLQR